MKELNKEQIELNKQDFLNLVNSITIDGFAKKEFIDYLLKSDFFTAPASTQYHGAYEGGLCEHSLKVYHTLVDLVNNYGSHAELNPDWNPDAQEEMPRYILKPNYSDDTIKIVALFHDLSKIDYYETYLRNVNTGEKDERGKDIWVKVPEYRVRPGNERFVGVDHPTNSYIILSRYLPLSEEELIAICNHHCGFDNNFVNKDLSFILDRYPLATLLHTADFLSTYILEKVSND